MISKEKLFLDFLPLLYMLLSSMVGSAGNLTQNCIIGTWNPMFHECNEDRKLIITDTFLSICFSDCIIQHSYTITDSGSTGGSFALKLFDSRISFDKGITNSNISGNLDSIKASIFLEKEIMTLLIWKGGDRFTEFQIAEAFIRKEGSEHEIYQSEIRSVFYLPAGYTGNSYVALEQPEGEPAEIDEEGRRVLYIPPSGLLLTMSKPMPTGLAKREFAFYYLDKDVIFNDPIPVIPHNCFYNFYTNELNDEQIKEYGFNPDQIYVYYHRYNPAREIVNNLFLKDIKGQVFMFRVDTLRNFLKPGN